MTRTLPLLLAGVLASLQGCGSGLEPPVQPVFTARFDGGEWTAESVHAAFDSVFASRLVVTATDSTALPDTQRMSFAVPFSGLGTYPLSYRVNQPQGEPARIHGFTFTVDSLGGGRAEFRATEDEANRLVVTRYDRIDGVVEGTFSVAVPAAGAPSGTVSRIQAGHFLAQIAE